jgi:hypothetical protein
LSLISKVKDALAQILLEKANQIESERLREAKRRKAEEFRRRLLHEQAVVEARRELNEYARLIREADGLLDKYDVEADRIILRQLHSRLESDPYYAAEEARGYCKILEKELKEDEEKARQREEEAWHGQKQIEALVQLLIHQGELDKIIKDLSWTAYELNLKSITNPNLEKTLVELYKKAGYEVNSLSDIEKTVKNFHVQALRDKLREKLKGNPYSWYAMCLTA